MFMMIPTILGGVYSYALLSPPHLRYPSVNKALDVDGRVKEKKE